MIAGSIVFQLQALLYELGGLREFALIDYHRQPVLPGLLYGAARSYTRTVQHSHHFRAAASYITGSHAFKVGGNTKTADNDNPYFYVNQARSYTFFNGSPQSVTQFVPFIQSSKLRISLWP